MLPKEKQCSDCGEFKSIENYYKNHRYKDGLSYYCKFCMGVCAKKYVQKNPEKVKKYQRQWRSGNNKDKIREYQINFRKRHPERYKAAIATRVAKRNGKLKPQSCTICISTENCESHHPDYSKPLEVIWLCRNHHQDLHAGRITLEPAKDLEVT